MKHILNRTILFIAILIGILSRVSGITLGESYIHYSFHDELEAYGLALDAAHGEESALHLTFPHVNNEADGKLPGLFYNGIFALMLMIYDNPYFAMIIPLILNILCIFLCYKITALLFKDTRVVILATILFAISPWTVRFSVGLYNPNFIPVICMSGMLFLIKAIKFRKSIYFIPCFFLVILGFHFHFIFMFIFASLIIFIVLYYPSKCIRYSALGIIAGILTFVPYLYFEIGTGFENTKNIISGAMRPELTFFKAFSNFIIISGAEISRWIGTSFEDYKSFLDYSFLNYIVGLIFIFITLIISISSVIFYFIKIKKIFKGTRLRSLKRLRNFAYENFNILFPILWVIFPFIIFMITLRPNEFRYQAIYFPVPFIMITFFLVNIYDKIKTHRKMFSTTIAIYLSIMIYIPFVFSFYQKNEIYNDSSTIIPSFKRYAQIEKQLSDITDGVCLYKVAASKSESDNAEDRNIWLLNRYFEIIADKDCQDVYTLTYTSYENQHEHDENFLFRSGNISFFRK